MKKQAISKQGNVTNTSKIICWQITNKCTKECDFCLSQSTPLKKHVNVAYKKVLKKLKEIGIEKISFSGGEPFGVKEFKEIAEFANQMGFVIIVTSNGDLISSTKYNIEWLKLFQYVKISFYGTKLYHDKIMGIGHYDKLRKLIKKLIKNGIKVGINYMLSNASITFIDSFIKEYQYMGIYSVLIQRYIPTGNPKVDKKYFIETNNINLKLEKYSKYFEKGIKFFDYNINKGFQIILEPNNDVYFPNINDSKKFYYGNLFSNNKIKIENKELSLKEIVSIISKKRLESENIINY